MRPPFHNRPILVAALAIVTGCAEHTSPATRHLIVVEGRGPDTTLYAVYRRAFHEPLLAGATIPANTVLLRLFDVNRFGRSTSVRIISDGAHCKETITYLVGESPPDPPKRYTFADEPDTSKRSSPDPGGIEWRDSADVSVQDCDELQRRFDAAITATEPAGKVRGGSPQWIFERVDAHGYSRRETFPYTGSLHNVVADAGDGMLLLGTELHRWTAYHGGPHFGTTGFANVSGAGRTWPGGGYGWTGLYGMFGWNFTNR